MQCVRQLATSRASSHPRGEGVRALLFILTGIFASQMLTITGPAAAANASDSADKPTVTIAYPLRNDQVSGAKVRVVISYVAGRTRVIRLDMIIDGVARYSENFNPPEAQNTKTFNLDTTQFSDAPHSIGARVVDEAGNTAVASVDVYVSNTTQDSTPPIVAITSPKPNQTVTGRTSVDIVARDNVAVKWVMLFVDDKFKLMKNNPPFNWVWDTLAADKDKEGKGLPIYPNGPHQLQAKALDPSNNEGFSPILRVFVYNPENDPSVGASTFQTPSPITNLDAAGPFSPITGSAAPAPSPAVGKPQEFGSVLTTPPPTEKPGIPNPKILGGDAGTGGFALPPVSDAGSVPEKTTQDVDTVLRFDVPKASPTVTTLGPTVLPGLQPSGQRTAKPKLDGGALGGVSLGTPDDKPQSFGLPPVASGGNGLPALPPAPTAKGGGGAPTDVVAPPSPRDLPSVPSNRESVAKPLVDPGKARPEIQEKTIVSIPTRYLATMRMTTDLQGERSIYSTELPSWIVTHGAVGSVLAQNIEVPDLIARIVIPPTAITLTSQRGGAAPVLDPTDSLLGGFIAHAVPSHTGMAPIDSIPELGVRPVRPVAPIRLSSAPFPESGGLRKSTGVEMNGVLRPSARSVGPTVGTPDLTQRRVAAARTDQSARASLSYDLSQSEMGLSQSNVPGAVRWRCLPSLLSSLPDVEFRKTIRASADSVVPDVTEPEVETRMVPVVRTVRVGPANPSLGQPEDSRPVRVSPTLTRAAFIALETLDVSQVQMEVKLARENTQTSATSESPGTALRRTAPDKAVSITRELPANLLADAVQGFTTTARRTGILLGIAGGDQPNATARAVQRVAAGPEKSQTSMAAVSVTKSGASDAVSLSQLSPAAHRWLVVVPEFTGALTQPEVPIRSRPSMSAVGFPRSNDLLRAEPGTSGLRPTPSLVKPVNVTPSPSRKRTGEPATTAKRARTYLAMAGGVAKGKMGGKSPVVSPIASTPEFVTFQLQEKLSANEPMRVQVRRRYLVKAGDTVNSIAKDYGVNAHSVIKANDLGRSAVIVPGQELVIPPGPLLVFFDAEPVTLDAPPSIFSGIALGPFRPIFEKGGGSVHWLHKGKQVVAKKDTHVVKLSIGSDIALINDSEVKLDVATFLRGGRTIVPIRFFREALGADVEWDPETGNIEIKTK
ncbi:MAG: hypothetical protein COZ56_12960 [Armatimonadetes bacterium CG_4_8_14_3_um_filter_58_9]|nr:MAG: hypothetical protein COZ56_12960 [Armatimonadetes bacterium CG_4_8_14_3_um_filter_58_9]